MAYDKQRYDEIQAMSAGELVHTMLVEFDPHYRAYGGEPGGAHLQSSAYLWAAERINELLPTRSAQDDGAHQVEEPQ